MTWLLFLLQENLQIYLKSTQGPIEVYLCPEEVQEPNSPAKEPLPSTSALSPSPDPTQPSSSINPGITESTASSGETLCPEGQGMPRGTSLRVSLFLVSICWVPTFYPAAGDTVLLPHTCALPFTLYKAHARSLSQWGDCCCSGQRSAWV